MEKEQSAPASKQEYDIELIHPPVRVADIRLRGAGMAQERLNAIERGYVQCIPLDHCHHGL